MSRHHLLLTALGLLCASPAGAAPEITVFTNRGTFEAALGTGRIIDDFSTAPPLLPVTTVSGAVTTGKWRDIARSQTIPSTTWQIPSGSLGWGGTWDLTTAGIGGGLKFELDFGGGEIIAVPTTLPGGSPADVFLGFMADQPILGVRVLQVDSQADTLQETHVFDDMTFALPANGEVAVHDGPTVDAPQLTDGQPTPLAFGTVARSTAATRTLTLSNTGTGTLRVIGLRVSDAKFQITSAPATPFTVAPGALTNFGVTFNSAAGGTFTGQVEIISSDADETRFNFGVTGHVTPSIQYQLINTQNGAVVTDGQTTVISPQPNEFGGGSSVSLETRNTGLDPLTITAVSVPAGFGIFRTLPFTIQPGQNDFISFTSTGPTAGFYSGNVTITSNSTLQPTITFPLSALFNMPEIQVLQGGFQDRPLGTTVDFGTTPLGQKKAVSLVVKNLHAGPLTVSGVTLPTGYALRSTAPAFPFSLTRNQSREIPVELTAQAPGTYSGTISIPNNDHDEGPFTLSLTGVVLTESMTFLGFNTFINEGGQCSATAFGSGAVTYEWDLDGDGQFDDATGQTINLPNTDGPGTFPASVRMTDSLTTMVRAGSIPIQNLTPSPNATIADSAIAGSSVTLSLAAGDAPVDRAAGMTWRVAWGDGTLQTTAAGHPSDTVFNHIFTQPGLYDMQIEVTDKDGAKGTENRSLRIHSAVLGFFDGPAATGEELRDGESELSFSAPAGSTQDHSITILNRSAASASLGPVTLPPGFALAGPPTFPAAIAPGASLTLTIRFAPPIGGEYDGILSLGTSDPLLSFFDLHLAGSSPAPELSVNQFSAERFDFDNDTESFDLNPGTGQFDGKSFNIESGNSEAPLIISSITVPAGFRLLDPPVFPLDFSGSSSVNIRVQCNGAAPGFYEGWVTIISNDPAASPFRFRVTSLAGEIADLEVKSADSDTSSATGLLFNGQTTTPALPLTLGLRNRGNLPLTISAVSLPAGFAFASQAIFPINLTASASAALPEIRLSATAPGTYSGQVTLTSTDPDENPFSFPISATIAGTTTAPELTGFNLTPSTASANAILSGTVTGPAGAIIIMEGSSDLSPIASWVEITRLTLNAEGHATFPPTPAPGTSGFSRYFFRFRLPP